MQSLHLRRALWQGLWDLTNPTKYWLTFGTFDLESSIVVFFNLPGLFVWNVIFGFGALRGACMQSYLEKQNPKKWFFCSRCSPSLQLTARWCCSTAMGELVTCYRLSLKCCCIPYCRWSSSSSLGKKNRQAERPELLNSEPLFLSCPESILWWCDPLFEKSTSAQPSVCALHTCIFVSLCCKSAGPEHLLFCALYIVPSHIILSFCGNQ